MVPGVGLEPTQLALLAPKASVSAISPPGLVCSKNNFQTYGAPSEAGACLGEGAQDGAQGGTRTHNPEGTRF